MITVVSIADATEQLRAAGMKISRETLREGIKQDKYPFGIGIKGADGGVVFQVFQRKLDDWIREVSDETECETV